MARFGSTARPAPSSDVLSQSRAGSFRANAAATTARTLACDAPV
jgi:hypothetical protein